MLDMNFTWILSYFSRRWIDALESPAQFLDDEDQIRDNGQQNPPPRPRGETGSANLDDKKHQDPEV
jgi:hypothetical protein